MILARELSLREIARVREQARLPVEVFVHGALCVAYSGQCLTSEALGGRSANRGECAQACRMPYEIVCDGERVDLGDVSYLLSPQDLAAFDLVPEAGPAGRGEPEDRGAAEGPRVRRQHHPELPAGDRRGPRGPARRRSGERDVHEMEMSFSRGFSHGFLDGNDHKVLVRGDYAKKRGVFLGRVVSVAGDRVRVDAGRAGQAGRRRRLRRRPLAETPRSRGAASTRSAAPGPRRRAGGGAGRPRGALRRARRCSDSAAGTSTSRRSSPASGSGRRTTPS